MSETLKQKFDGMPDEVRAAAIRYGRERNMDRVPVQYREGGGEIWKEDHPDLVETIVEVPALVKVN